MRMRRHPWATACRVSLWPLCDAFDKCRGPLLNAYPIYLLYLPLIFYGA